MHLRINVKPYLNQYEMGGNIRSGNLTFHEIKFHTLELTLAIKSATHPRLFKVRTIGI